MQPFLLDLVEEEDDEVGVGLEDLEGGQSVEVLQHCPLVDFVHVEGLAFLLLQVLHIYHIDQRVQTEQHWFFVMSAGGQQEGALLVLLKKECVAHVGCRRRLLPVEVGFEASDDVGDAGVEFLHFVQREHFLVLVEIPNYR